MTLPGSKLLIDREAVLSNLAVEIERPLHVDHEEERRCDTGYPVQAPERYVRRAEQEEGFDGIDAEQVHALERPSTPLLHTSRRQRLVLAQMLTERLPEEELVRAEIDLSGVLTDQHLTQMALSPLEQTPNEEQANDRGEVAFEGHEFVTHERVHELADEPGNSHRQQVRPKLIEREPLRRLARFSVHENPPDPGIGFEGGTPVLAVVPRVLRLAVAIFIFRDRHFVCHDRRPFWRIRAPTVE